MLAVVVFGLGIYWLSQWAVSDESPASEKKRLTAVAHREIAEAITNDVVGLRTVLSVSVNTHGDNPWEWTGSATVEFFNKAGGVERRSLGYRFYPHGDDLACKLEFSH